MQNFRIRPMTWPGSRIFGNNPLIRTGDRIESAVVALAIVLVIAAGVCAGAIGMVVRDSETQNYLAQARTRHAVVARAADDSNPAVSPKPTATTLHARWQFNGVDHADAIVWDHAVKAGELLRIWVDDSGSRVDPPTPIAAADMDAVAAAVAEWSIAAFAAGLVVFAVRAHVARMRDIQWDQEIRCLVEDGGGRTNTAQ
jgi:hypothetical protein